MFLHDVLVFFTFFFLLFLPHFCLLLCPSFFVWLKVLCGWLLQISLVSWAVDSAFDRILCPSYQNSSNLEGKKNASGLRKNKNIPTSTIKKKHIPISIELPGTLVLNVIFFCPRLAPISISHELELLLSGET